MPDRLLADGDATSAAAGLPVDDTDFPDLVGVDVGLVRPIVKRMEVAEPCRAEAAACGMTGSSFQLMMRSAALTIS